MLPWAWVADRLLAARNYWLVTSKADGAAHAAPVWGLWIDDAVVFSTSRQSRKGRNLMRDPRVVVHLESGDEVVIIEGEVEEISLDERLADAYEAKYAYRPGGEAGGFWLHLHPEIVLAWTESDYPATVTRFSFA